MKMLDTETRIQLKNVLFLTDFSPAADAAAPYAAEVAKRFGAKLYALHVQTPIINPMTEPATWAVLEKAAEEEAATHRATLLNSFPGQQTEALIREGGLIVLGTRGRSGLAKFFLGSAAEEIFRKAPCPVLTVGPFSPGQPERSAKFFEIVYATDFSNQSVAAASYALSIAQEFQAHLTLLHVIAADKAGELVRSEELVNSAERRLRDLIPPDVDLWCEPRFVVKLGSAAEKILEVAQERNANLIVLGLRRPGGFPGAATHLPIATAHRVVSHAHCPVLSVRG
jgi:nucleotide-binding universal stress UspA family protein